MPASASRLEQQVKKEKVMEVLDDVEQPVTCSSRYADKDVVILLGSTMGMGMAEETLQIQAERKPAEVAKA